MQFQLTAAALFLATSAMADMPGYGAFSFDAPHHGRGVTGAYWHPSPGDGRAFTYAENAVFQGVEVVEEASVSPGQHPLLLLSHGMGGHVRSLAWLATDLAARGAIVVAVNHPNSTWSDLDFEIGLQHWTRVQDLSQALDVILADPKLADHIDTSRIMAAGFSYGGWTALSMAGLRADHAGYVAHCDANKASSHCADLARAGVDFDAVPAAEWDADHKDARITHAFAIDPALIWGLDESHVSALVDNVTLVALGEGENRLLATNFDLSGFDALVPDATIDRIAGASHFTALPLCKEMGAQILEDENDDPVCTDPEGADRAAVHKRIADQLAADLGL